MIIVISIPKQLLLRLLFFASTGCLIGYKACTFYRHRTKGCQQMRVHLDTKKYTAFCTPTKRISGVRANGVSWNACCLVAVVKGSVWQISFPCGLHGRHMRLFIYMDEHIQHLEVLSQVLRAKKLFAHRDQCKFGIRDLIFLAYTSSHHSLHVDNSKAQAITN